jgi:hypothetical protein
MISYHKQTYLLYPILVRIGLNEVMSSTEYKYKTTFFDCKNKKQQGDPLQYMDEIKEILTKDYGVKDYLIAYEERNAKGEYKPHVHTIYLTSESNGTNFVKKIVSKYGLRGNTKGGRRYYGTLKEPIRDLEKLRVYCSKDGNVISSLSNEELDRLAKKSFKKDNLEIKEKLVKYLDEVVSNKYWKHDFTEGKTYYITQKQLALEIITYMTNNKIHLRKSLLDSYIIYYRQFSQIAGIQNDPEELLFLLYSKDPYQIN